MKIFLQLVSCFLALHAATLVDSSLMSWQEFKDKFRKVYSTEQEEKYRMKLFMDRRTVIELHNAKYENGSATYKMGINKYSDMTLDEFVLTYTGLKKLGTHKRTGETTVNFPNDMSVPDYVNWLEKGAVTPVKNQGACGSCYAFSATGSMEGQHFMKTGKLVSLSEQNIVDCSRNFGNSGCYGGLMDNVFEYVIKNEGIDTEASYPYKAFGWRCRFKNDSIGATFSSFKDLPSGDENALEKAVATIGPISVAVDASNFMSYQSGIFSDPDCSTVSLDHGVLAVGYGIDNATQQHYWLVKNSWGAEWGENGYIRIARNANNMCGIATQASYPVV